MNSQSLSAHSAAWPTSPALSVKHSALSPRVTGESPSELDDRAPGFVGLRLWVEQEVEAHVRKAFRELAPSIIEGGTTSKHRGLDEERLLRIEREQMSFTLELDRMRDEWYGVVADEQDAPSHSPPRLHSKAGARDAGRKGHRAVSSKSERSPSPRSSRSPARAAGDRGLLRGEAGGSKLRPLQLHIADQAKRCKALAEELAGVRETVSCLRREARAAASAAVSAQRHSDRVESQLASVSCDRESLDSFMDSAKLQATVEQAARVAAEAALDQRLTPNPQLSPASVTDSVASMHGHRQDRTLLPESSVGSRRAHPSLFGAWAGEESGQSDCVAVNVRCRSASPPSSRAKGSSSRRQEVPDDKHSSLSVTAVDADSPVNACGATDREIRGGSDDQIVTPQLLDRNASAERRRRGNASNHWLAGRGRHWRAFGSRAFSSDSEEAECSGISRGGAPAVWRDSSPKSAKPISTKKPNGARGFGTTAIAYSDSE